MVRSLGWKIDRDLDAPSKGGAKMEALIIFGHLHGRIFSHEIFAKEEVTYGNGMDTWIL